MNTNRFPELQLAPDFQAVWDDMPTLQNAYEVLRATTLEEYRAAMPDLQGFDPDTTVRFVDNCPDDADASEAIVVPFPFATGVAPHTLARMSLVQAAADRPTRLIALPNPTAGAPVISLDKPELGRIAQGDFTPYSDRVLRTLEHLGVTAVHVIGYSQGAATGGHLLGRLPDAFEGLPSGIFDPPNLVRQPVARLTKGFVATGMRAVHGAMQAAHIPWLLESVRTESRRQAAINLLQYARSAATGVNNALALGMARHAIGDDLYAAADKGTRLTLMRAQKSTVTLARPFFELAEGLEAAYPDHVQHFEAPNAGHEIGDNIVVHGIMTAIALQKNNHAFAQTSA